MNRQGEVEALQACLAAEHAVVYGYGVLGPRLDAEGRRQALGAFDSHRVRRDLLAAAVRLRGAAPVLPEAAYDAAAPSAAEALALAVRLEAGMSVRWRDVVTGTADEGLRRLALAALVETAVRAAQWRQRAGAPDASVAFPGAG